MIEQYLAWSGFSDNGGATDPMVKGGQDALIVPGTIEWTVPEGVTAISVAVMSAGLQGRAQSVAASEGGRGGCVRWKNNIPVTPGETYTIVVGSGGIAQAVPYGTASAFQTNYASTAFGLNVGTFAGECTTIDATVGGTNSFSGQVVGGSSGDAKGGDSGTYLINGAASNYAGCSPLGTRVPGSLLTGGKHGGGGGAQVRDIGNRQTGRGGDGFVRIMWGNGRAYPSTNIADRV